MKTKQFEVGAIVIIEFHDPEEDFAGRVIRYSSTVFRGGAYFVRFFRRGVPVRLWIGASDVKDR